MGFPNNSQLIAVYTKNKFQERGNGSLLGNQILKFIVFLVREKKKNYNLTTCVRSQENIIKNNVIDIVR